MEKKKGAGKRGRPRKNPVKLVEDGPKRKRGRPSKSRQIEGIGNIEIMAPIAEEVYIEPKLLRKKRVFRFDKNIFHTFSNKFGGDIVKMSYVINEIMSLYILKKLDIAFSLVPLKYYDEWCKGSPPIEPLNVNEIAQAHAVTRGIPLQYKYPLIFDEIVFSAFEKSCDHYPPFILNKLLQMYLDDKNRSFMDKNIDISKSERWCNF